MAAQITINGGAGGVISDQSGSDLIIFNTNPATLTASQGTDMITAGSGLLVVNADVNFNPVSIQGASGDLIFYGGPGAATITGGGGRITILPGNGTSNGTITIATQAGEEVDVYPASDIGAGYAPIITATAGTMNIVSSSGQDAVVDTSAGINLVVTDVSFSNTDNSNQQSLIQPPVVINGTTAGISVDSSGNITTSDHQPTLTGNATPNSTIMILDSSMVVGSGVADLAGNWTVPLTVPLPSGVTTLTATSDFYLPDGLQIDSLVTSSPIGLNVVAGVLAAPTITSISDLGGAESSGATTVDLTPQINGTVAAGSTVQVFSNGALLGNATIDSSGTNWSFAPPMALSFGSNVLTAVATDPASGTVSAPSQAVDLTVAVTTPTVDGFTNSAGGITTGPGDTSTHRPTLTGTTEAGTDVTIYDGTTQLGTATVSGSNWSFTPSADLGDGIHAITAVAEDMATSTTSAISAPLALTIDPNAPVLNTLSGPSGAVSNDGITADTGLVLSGSTDAGTTVEVLMDGTLLGAASVNGASWSFALSPGSPSFNTHVLSASSTDPLDGKTNSASNTFVFTELPAPPVLIGLTPASDTGISSSDGITSNAEPTITGTAIPGALVTILDGTTTLGTATANPTTGAWLFTPTAVLADGTHTLTATSTDPSGTTTSASSAALSITIVPAAPSVIAVDGNAAAGSLSISDSQPMLSGAGQAGTTIALYDGSGTTAIGSATVGADGTWSASTVALSVGVHDLTAVATDAAGLTGDVSTTLALTVDPGAPTLTGLSGGSGAVPAGGTASDTGLVLTGTGQAGTVVTIQDGAMILGTVNVGGPNWSFGLPVGLVDGPHSLTATASDTFDGATSTSVPFAFTEIPAAPVITGLTSGEIASAAANSTASADPTITGTATANATVTLYEASALLGVTQADGTGQWSLAPASSLAEGPHTLTATSTDPVSGLTSGSSAANIITIVPPVPPAPFVATLDGVSVGGGVSGQLTQDAQPTLSGTGEAGDTIALMDGSTVIDTSGTIGLDGTWTLMLPAKLSTGLHVFTAVATSAQGVTGPASAPLPIVINPVADPTTTQTDPLATQIRNSIGSLASNGAGGGIVVTQPGQTAPASGQVTTQAVGDSQANSVVDATASQYVSSDTSGPVTVDGANGQIAVSTGGDLTYVAGTGSVKLLADQSSGSDVLWGSTDTNSQLVAATGAGNDVLIGRAGQMTLSGGGGDNLFYLEGGSALIDSSGADTVAAFGGATTVNGGIDPQAPAGSQSVLLFAGSNSLTFNNHLGNATVTGGSGSSTLTGGSGDAYFFGGHAGRNVLVSGDGASTLVGGGANDLLYAQGSGSNWLVAGGANATLAGGVSNGNTIYFGQSFTNVMAAGNGNSTLVGGSARSTIFGGAGNDVVFDAAGGGIYTAGSGNATLIGGHGPDLYVFNDGKSGGNAQIYSFRPGVDTIALENYGPNAIARQTVQAGSTQLVLSDGTHITFMGLAHLPAGSIV